MILVDSSGWLEYFADGKNAKHFAEAIEDTDNLVVSSINIYEVYKKILAFKNEQSAIIAIGLMQQSKVVEVNSSIAIQAAKLSFKLKIPMADSLIYITAKNSDALLLTQDSDFIGLENIKFIK
ncbi:MAG: type II toxin-antitoxin system VapC family toxin [Ignavibacteria bacterium]|nr:type II toxin-antitoxin system VapC family toxin [Ignavibacteria bacterium]